MKLICVPNSGAGDIVQLCNSAPIHHSDNETVGRADKRRATLTVAVRPYRGAAKTGDP
jgi:hypothetical protein